MAKQHLSLSPHNDKPRGSWWKAIRNALRRKDKKGKAR